VKAKEYNFDEVCRFIIRLGTAAHGYGSNAARLEMFLSRLTTALGFHGVFRSTPTEIVFAFEESEGQPQRTHLVALPGTGLELNRLARVGELVDDVVAGQTSLAEATKRLDEIGKIAHPWGNLTTAASYTFAGAAFAVLLSGGWWDVLFSALYSLVVFLMVLLAGRFGALAAAWIPLSTAFVAGALTAGTKILLPELNLVLVTLSAILILIPGYPVSVGIVELVSQHVVSGVANLMNGLVYLAKQFIGAWLGVGVVGLAWSVAAAAPGAAVSSEWLWLMMPLLIVSLCVAFQTPRRDFLWATLICAAAYGGILLGSQLAGGNLGNLLGTVVAVVCANLWARKTLRPTSITLLPAIVLLVSGSIGFRGLVAVAVGQTAAGEQQFLQMFVVALTIAAGLLVGNTLVRPKTTL
jgi:uncharacterized membrane protein YjjP (DUF1212 family)